MPKKPIDYSQTVIYKIACNNLDIKECYVGHTTDLVRRRKQHKHCCISPNKHYNYNVYQFIRDNGGWENWCVCPVEEFKCDNINQALIRERFWIEELNANLNQNIPSRTEKERYENNKEEIQQQRKEYREKNKEKIAQKDRKYYEEHKEEKQKYDKEYYEQNKEKKIEQAKIYYENNKEELDEKRKEKITCECGGFTVKSNLARHIKSKKHQEYLLTNTISE